VLVAGDGRCDDLQVGFHCPEIAFPWDLTDDALIVMANLIRNTWVLSALVLAVAGCATVDDEEAAAKSTAKPPKSQRCQPHMNGDGSVWKVTCRD
jgi:hypothetical protein